ncbi:MAG: DUF2818 family protein [Methylophilales bacterium]|nr:MAG: hypothetical protein ABS29_02725 [Methylophilales bacterium BACL14 MAG-120920-bin58]NQW34180.1 DUF2818 family protein [Methylophilales bacterium]HCK04390.1 DUF2818 domain-containing protein [Methylophilaceae bacterium]
MINLSLILFTFLVANIPWLSNNLFVFFPMSKPKSISIIMLEVIVFYFFLGGFFVFIEKQVVGNIHSQEWEFYIITFFLFLVFSFPGFIYKIVWK